MAYQFTYTNNCNETTIIQARNVKTKNPQHALQFIVEQDKGKRRYTHCFDLPAKEIPIFVAAIQKED